MGDFVLANTQAVQVTMVANTPAVIMSKILLYCLTYILNKKLGSLKLAVQVFSPTVLFVLLILLEAESMVDTTKFGWTLFC
jgi:TctA family transporter